MICFHILKEHHYKNIAYNRFQRLKGIVQRILTGDEIMLKQSVLISYTGGKFLIIYFQGTPL
jgi:hypothetical protein